MAITIDVLPAGYGDCLLVSCPVPGGTWRLLMDTGPDETWPALKARLGQIPPNPAGARPVDLAIVSHIDHDHIGAAHLVFGDRSLGLSFSDIWFNTRQHLERGALEGETLASLLGAPERPMPWNLAFNGGAVVTPGDGAYLELPSPPGYPRLTLLSPTPKRLTRLATVWDAELARLRAKQSNTELEAVRGSEFPDLGRLAAHKSARDQSAPNGSSIALLLEHQGASALLAADAFPTVLGSALLNLATARRATLPLVVDAFKLSHHGSRGNLPPELLKVVSSKHYLVSTDNARFGHPHDEALARVVLQGGSRPNLCFNFATPHNLRWADTNLQSKHGFSTEFPAGTGGFRLELPARQ